MGDATLFPKTQQANGDGALLLAARSGHFRLCRGVRRCLSAAPFVTRMRPAGYNAGMVQANNSGLLQALRHEATRLGFSMLGLVAAGRPKRLNAYLDWIAAEMHGTMGYMARPDRIARRQDPSVILAGAQTIVCVGLDYLTPPLPEQVAADPGRGRISNYAWQRDYHDVMLPRLEALADWLRAHSATTVPVRHRAYVDTGAILERDVAEQAGLGFTGKNTMLIAPRRGSWFFLGELLTTLPPEAFGEPPGPAPLPGCGRCTRCLTACPTDAFPRPYVLDARRCISYLTIELKGSIPPALRPLMGNWVYGCDVCQAVCPFNRFALPVADSAFHTDDINRKAPPLLDLLALDEAAFVARFAGSPILRIGRGRLVRNACVAAGNWGSETAVAPLTHLRDDADPLVQEHAAWALARIRGATGQGAD